MIGKIIDLFIKMMNALNIHLIMKTRDGTDYTHRKKRNLQGQRVKGQGAYFGEKNIEKGINIDR